MSSHFSDVCRQYRLRKARSFSRIREGVLFFFMYEASGQVCLDVNTRGLVYRNMLYQQFNHTTQIPQKLSTQPLGGSVALYLKSLFPYSALHSPFGHLNRVSFRKSLAERPKRTFFVVSYLGLEEQSRYQAGGGYYSSGLVGIGSSSWNSRGTRGGNRRSSGRLAGRRGLWGRWGHGRHRTIIGLGL